MRKYFYSVVSTGNVIIHFVSKDKYPVTYSQSEYNALKPGDTFTFHVDIPDGSTIQTLLAYGADGTQYTIQEGDNHVITTVVGQETWIVIGTQQTYAVGALSNDTLLGNVSGGGTYVEYTQITLTATPTNGCSFVKWEEDDSVDNPKKFYVTEDITYTAIFEGVPVYTITIGNVGNGTIEVDRTEASAGDIVIITPHPEEGYVAESIEDYYVVIINSGVQVEVLYNEETGEYGFEMPAGNVKIEAYFLPAAVESFSIFSDVSTGSGTIDAPETGNVGEIITFTCTPKTGYKLIAAPMVERANTKVPEEIELLSYDLETGVCTFKVNENLGDLWISCRFELITHIPGVGVDMGTSILWSNINIGCIDSEDQGSYYAWGELETRSRYSQVTYTYDDSPTTLPEDRDIAHQLWGGTWRMPTEEEFIELLNNCTQETQTINGMAVIVLTSITTNNQLTIPCSGLWTDFVNYYPNHRDSAYLLTASKGSDDSECKIGNFTNVSPIESSPRHYGYTIRPVCTKTTGGVVEYTTTDGSSIEPFSDCVYCDLNGTSAEYDASASTYGRMVFKKPIVAIGYTTDANQNQKFVDSNVLQTLTFPEGLRFLGCNSANNESGDYYTIRGTALTTVNLPDSLEEIGTNMFVGCTALKTMIVPKNVKVIYDQFCRACTSLETVSLPEGLERLGYDNTSDGYFFYGCSSLKELTIPSTVSYIRGSCVLMNCASFKTLTLLASAPDYEYQFGNSSMPLKTLIFGEKTTTIGRNIHFGGNYGLTTIQFLGSEPPTVMDWSTCFYNATVEGTILVPKGSLEAYKASDWYAYFAISPNNWTFKEQE